MRRVGQLPNISAMSTETSDHPLDEARRVRKRKVGLLIYHRENFQNRLHSAHLASRIKSLAPAKSPEVSSYFHKTRST